MRARQITPTSGSSFGGGTVGSVLFVGSGPVISENNSAFFWDNANSILGVGISSSFAASRLEVVNAAATTGATAYLSKFKATSAETGAFHSYGVYTESFLDPSAGSQALAFGLSAGGLVASGNAQTFTGASEIGGFVGGGTHAGTGTIPIVQGYKAQVYVTSTGTATALYGGRFLYGHNHSGGTSGTITTAYGLSLEAKADNSSTITSLYGLNINLSTLSATAITTAVGIIIGTNANSGGITNSFGIQQQGSSDANYFAGQLRLGNTSGTNSLGRAIENYATAPGMLWKETDGGSDAKIWDSFVNGGVLTYRLVNDAIALTTNWLVVTRSGLDISSIALSAGNPAGSSTVIHNGTSIITGGVTDGYTAGLRLTPTYSAGSALTVTRHNYIDINQPTLSGAGPAALTDGCVFRFDAAAGTHKAVDSGTTKTSPGTVTQWIKINVNGTIAYIPTYSSKTS